MHPLIKKLTEKLGIKRPVTIILPPHLAFKPKTDFHDPDYNCEPVNEVVEWLQLNNIKHQVKPGWRDCAIIFRDPIDAVQFKLSFNFSL